MNLYEIKSIELKIQQCAQDNDGEISERLLQELVNAQTKSIETLEKLCHYIRHLENFVEECKDEKERINNKQQMAAGIARRIKNYLVPYVNEIGKIDIGTMTLSTRKSSSVLLSDDFNDARFTTIETVHKHDKNRIKEAIRNGAEIRGAQVVTKDNINIK